VLTAAELAGMRETATAALAATCTISRAAGEPVLNPATSQYDVTPAETVYVGPCRVRTLNTQDMAVLVGDLHETLSRYIATLPHTATGIEVDDFLTVTAGTDPDLIGRPLRVTDVRWSEWQIDRRVVLEDRQQT
jgi:hypothetical protein